MWLCICFDRLKCNSGQTISAWSTQLSSSHSVNLMEMGPPVCTCCSSPGLCRALLPSAEQKPPQDQADVLSVGSPESLPKDQVVSFWGFCTGTTFVYFCTPISAIGFSIFHSLPDHHKDLMSWAAWCYHPTQENGQAPPQKLSDSQTSEHLGSHH